MVRFIPRNRAICVHRLGIGVGTGAILEELILKRSEKFPEGLPLETIISLTQIIYFSKHADFPRTLCIKIFKKCDKRKNPFL
jgi:hypothetical protein